jgi:hypothetical protein
MAKKIIFSIVAILVFIVIQSCSSDKKLSVLFIGNSFTYRNEMPNIFKNIALSKGKRIDVHSVTQGKATFQIQSNREEVYKAINLKKWDYVILQGSSRDMLASKDTMQDKTLPSIEKIVTAINTNSSKSKVLFYQTWGYKNGYVPLKSSKTYVKMSRRVAYGYLKLLKKFNYGVVPVGMAWLESRKKRPEVNLYVKDGAHPSWKGSYLTASCFYTAIFNESAEGSEYYGVLGPKICHYLQVQGNKQVSRRQKRYGLLD